VKSFTSKIIVCVVGCLVLGVIVFPVMARENPANIGPISSPPKQVHVLSKLDGMNEMSEMTALRLQMTMDRRSKFIGTLSNIMKKIGHTQDELAQNI
jgi:hypothetical protein